MSIQPRHVICVLGRWDSFTPVRSIVDSVSPGFTLDLEYSQLEPDTRMKAAFKASLDRNNPTIKGDEWQTIGAHSAVAYILSPPIKRKEWESISATALLLVAELLKKGGVAAKSESEGLAHGRDRWLDLASQYRTASEDSDAHGTSAALYRAWVQRAIHDEDTKSLYSVGMHLLGHRDVEIDDDLDLSDAVKWIDLMGLYLIADKPNRALREGEGFRLSENCKVGDSVKLLFRFAAEDAPRKDNETERMWVTIADVDDDSGFYTGVIDNDPVHSAAAYGDAIQFHPLHIVEIIKKRGRW